MKVSTIEFLLKHPSYRPLPRKYFQENTPLEKLDLTGYSDYVECRSKEIPIIKRIILRFKQLTNQ